MNLEPFVLPALFIAAASICTSLIAITFGAFRYDIRETARQRDIKRHPNSKVNRARPLITVLISANNHQRTLEKCLDSIFDNNYWNVEIFIVDNLSTFRAGKVTRNYNYRYSRRTIKHVFVRRNSTVTQAAAKSIKRHGKGDYVITLPADSTLGKNTLSNVSRALASRLELDALILRRQFSTGYSLAGLFAMYRSLLAIKLNKYEKITGSSNTACEIMCYRKSAFLSLYSAKNGAAKQKLHIGFAQDAIVKLDNSRLISSSGINWKHQNFEHRTWRRSLLLMNIHLAAGLAAILASYFLYLALRLHEPALLFTLLGIFSTWMALAIWEDENIGAYKKSVYVLGIPITFGLFYFAAVYKVLAVLLSTLKFAIGNTRNLRQAGSYTGSAIIHRR